MPKPARNIYCTGCKEYKWHCSLGLCSKCYTAHYNKKRRSDPEYRKQENESRRIKRKEDPEYKEEQNNQQNERRRKRYATDPEYRQEQIEKASKWIRKNPEKRQQWKNENREEQNNKRKQRRQEFGRSEEDRRYTKHKKELVETFGLKCSLRNESKAFQGCGIDDDYTYENLTIDHKWPVSKQDLYPGNDIHEIENLQLVCQSCNSKKKDKLMIQYCGWQ